MPRNNKKTRIKGLPPRLQLQQNDAATGSYPTNVRVASDNRTGTYKINYDDLNTITFGESESILDHVSSYWRFRSGSINEIFPIELSAPSASYKVVPTFLNQENVGENPTPHLYYRAAYPSSFDQFSTMVPFAGPTDDPNTTSLQFFPGDFPVLSGALSLFNPGSENIVSGANEKEFTVAFWVHPLNNNSSSFVLQTPINVSEESAIFTGGVTTGSLFRVENIKASGNNSFRVVLTDPNNNSIGKTLNTNVSESQWTHLAFTYDGSKTYDGIKIYLNGELATNTGNIADGTYLGMTSSNSDHQLYIGRLANDTSTQFDGLLDEIVFVNKALTDASTRALYDFTRTLSNPKNNPFTGVYYGLGLNTNSRFIKHPTEQTSSLFGTGRVVKGIGDSAASFTPGQDLTPFRDNNNPASDGKSSNSSFYSVGSPVDKVGEGFSQPLWSKTKIEIDLPVSPGSGSNTIQTYVSGGFNVITNADPASGSVQKFTAGGTDPNGFGVVGLSYPMSYYNFDSQRWEGVGRGEALGYIGLELTSDQVTVGVAPFTPTRTIGFSQGLITQREDTIDVGLSGAFEYVAGAGHPVSNFGFPFDARYHATSSQTLKMNRFISEPFVVEKIVVDFSGAFEFSSTNFTTATITPNINNVISAALPAAINNFFILVQRRPFSFDVNLAGEVTSLANTPDITLYSKLPTEVTLSNGADKTFVDTTRELLTYAGITSFAENVPNNVFRQGNVGGGLLLNAEPSEKNIKELFSRDVNIETGQTMSNDLTALNWSGSFKIEVGSRNTAQAKDLFGMFQIGNEIAFTSSDLKNDFGGRNGLGVTKPSGRDIVSPINAIDIQSRAINGRTNKEIILSSPESHYKFGGYILKPEDSLVFGWQQPMPLSLTTDFSLRHVNDGVFSTMTFFGAKITIYGSLVREGKEYHDTLNQLLSSDSVHEVIE